MGAADGEYESPGNERPQHRVHIAGPFAIGRYALSFDDYDHYDVDAVGENIAAPESPGLVSRLLGRKQTVDRALTRSPDKRGWGRGRRPVIFVSWDQVVAYSRWLATQTGRPCRLPSEAEWEYAARAGTTTPFWWGESITTDQGNYNGNYTYGGGPEGEYREKTLPVDAFDANPWGLYQVHGNVLEWVQDCWNENYVDAPDDGSAWEKGDCHSRLVRGGWYFIRPWRLRSANRNRATRGNGGIDIGVRLAQDLSL